MGSLETYSYFSNSAYQNSETAVVAWDGLPYCCLAISIGTQFSQDVVNFRLGPAEELQENHTPCTDKRNSSVTKIRIELVDSIFDLSHSDGFRYGKIPFVV